MIGGGSRISQDIAPYVKAAGSPPRLAGINSIGLQRRGFTPEAVVALERAYRMLFRDKLTAADAVARMRAELDGVPEVEVLARFVETSSRGITR
jgi:UDP-N-acetylglucosamine acyltransferase